MNRLSWRRALGALLACVSPGLARENGFEPGLSRIKDGKVWSVVNASCDTAVTGGKRVVRSRPKGVASTASDVGLALLEGWSSPKGPSKST